MSSGSFDRIAFCYDFLERYILKDYQGSMDLIHKHLTIHKNDYVLDIGGGTGFFSRQINENILKSVVIDPSEKMLKKITNPTISKIQGEGGFLCFHDNTFDLAVLIDVLHHIPYNKQQKVLNETMRILKEKGRIFVIEVFFPKTLINRLFCMMENLAVGHTYHLSAQHLQLNLKKAGFTKISMTYPKDHNWKYVALGTKK